MTKLQVKMYKNFLKYKNVYGGMNSATANSQMTTRKICNHQGSKGSKIPPFLQKPEQK